MSKEHAERATVHISIRAEVGVTSTGEITIRELGVYQEGPPLLSRPHLPGEGHDRNPWFEGGVAILSPDHAANGPQMTRAVTAAAARVITQLRRALRAAELAGDQACMCCVDNECECQGRNLGPAYWPSP